MNVPYNEINAKDAAKRIGVDYSTVIGWCRRGLINFINFGGGTKNPRYMLTEKEVEHLREEFKKFGKYFIKKYDKDWDMPEEVYGTESCDNPLEFEVTQMPIEPQEDIPTRKPFNLENITTTISYMQDIKDRISAIEREKNQLLEKVNDIEAEKNQLINEYSDLKTEVNEALAL